MNYKIDNQSLATIPAEQDLRILPLRALVAFATRCARRVQPQFLLPSICQDRQDSVSAVEQAIVIAEAYARAEPVDSRQACAAGTKAKAIAEVIQKIPFCLQQAMVANAAAEAALAAYAAASDLKANNAIVAKAFMLAATQGDNIIDKTFAETRGLHTANFVARSSAFAANASPVAASDMSRDFVKLRELRLGDHPESGQPIDPGTVGPLGPLWLDNVITYWYAVDDDHPFYDEMLQFNVSAISLQALLTSSLIQKAYGKAVENDHHLQREGAIPLIELPDPRLEMHLLEENCPDECVINTVPTVEYLIGNTNRPIQLLFALKTGAGLFPDISANSGKIDSHVGSTLETTICYLVGGAFEKRKKHFRDRFGSDERKWPPEVQFFRHLRNACFHGNSFNMQKRRDGSDQIDPTNPPKWHYYIMPADHLLNGQKAIDGYFHFAHILPFLHDMGKFV